MTTIEFRSQLTINNTSSNLFENNNINDEDDDDDSNYNLLRSTCTQFSSTDSKLQNCDDDEDNSKGSQLTSDNGNYGQQKSFIQF